MTSGWHLIAVAMTIGLNLIVIATDKRTGAPNSYFHDHRLAFVISHDNISVSIGNGGNRINFISF